MISRPVYGTGKVVIEYFRDHQCAPCGAFTRTELPYLMSLAKKNEITLIIRQYPLSTYHQNAYRDALAGLCALEQGKYETYAMRLYDVEKRVNGGDVKDTDRLGFARKMKLDISRFYQCLSGEKYAPIIEEDIQIGDRYGITGIPSIFRDGNPLELRSDLRLYRDTILS
jgi:protein-disulfide isomerase